MHFTFKKLERGVTTSKKVTRRCIRLKYCPIRKSESVNHAGHLWRRRQNDPWLGNFKKFQKILSETSLNHGEVFKMGRGDE